MALITCDFDFERPSRVYYGGDKIIGNCVLRTTADILEYKELSLKFVGYSSMNWKAKSKDPGETQQHNDCEVQLTQYVYNQLDKKFHCDICPIDLSEMPDKSLKLRFSFVAPLHKPASMSLASFKIYYRVKMSLKSTESKTYKFEKNVFVKQRLDLNKPEIREILAMNYPREYDNGFVRLLLDQDGYVPGQKINYELKINRLCYYHKTWISLLQVVRCKTGMPRSYTRILSENKHMPSKNDTQMEDQLAIPLTVAISTLKQNHLVDISYVVRCLMVDKHRRVMQIFKVPIVIGTVPLPKEMPTESGRGLFGFTNFGALSYYGSELVKWIFDDEDDDENVLENLWTETEETALI